MEELVANASWLQSRREAAWAYGRELRDHLIGEYQRKYDLVAPPPPALIVPELISDVMGAELHYDPLPLDRYAEVRLDDGRFVVTVNSDIEKMPNVKDAVGVANVAMWHEVIHIDSHASVLEAPTTLTLPGFDAPPPIVCYRAPKSGATASEVAAREFWAEEAGRAAAVSISALRVTEPFKELMRLAQHDGGHVAAGFPLLYDAAAAIAVNISALTNQLQFEGLIAIEHRDGRPIVLVQPGLWGGARDEV
jgi:hypothetical protein